MFKQTPQSDRAKPAPRFRNKKGVAGFVGVCLIGGVAASANAAPGTPTFQVTFDDATTFQNEFTDTDGKQRWTITPGADDFETDLYERPVVQNFRDYKDQNTDETKFATDDDYWGNLDITQASAGFDNQFLYIAIDMHDTNRHPPDGQVEHVGLDAEYRVRLSNDPLGNNGFMFAVESPYQNFLDLQSDSEDPHSWVTTRNFVHWDENGDLAFDGAQPDFENDRDQATGYETEIVNDGKIKSGFSQFGEEGDMPFYSRIRPGGDDSVVEFAIEYAKFDLSKTDLQTLPYLEFESNRVNSSSESPDKYLLNHVFAKIDAGSPYAEDQGEVWGTQGPKDINEIDTLRGGAIPEPTSLALLGLACIGLMIRRRPRAAS